VARRALNVVLLTVAAGAVACSSQVSTTTPTVGPLPPSSDAAVSSPRVSSATTPSLASCPFSFASTDLAMIRGGPATQMVAPGASGVTICAYDQPGTAAAFGKLGKMVTLGASGAAQLIDLLNGLQSRVSGSQACGPDYGAVYVLIFRYAGGNFIDVAAQPAGCLDVTNGQSLAVMSDGLTKTLSDLAKA
jgi:hypothetical protein